MLFRSSGIAGGWFPVSRRRLLDEHEFVAVDDEAAKAREPVAPRVFAEVIELGIRGRAAPGELGELLDLAVKRGRIRGEPGGEPIAGSQNELVVPGCQRLERAKGLRANGRDLSAVGAVERVHEGIRKSSEQESVDGAAHAFLLREFEF